MTIGLFTLHSSSVTPLCRLTIAKSGFVRIIRVLCNKGERGQYKGGQLSQLVSYFLHVFS